MIPDFNQRIDRRNTNCAKWDEMDEKYQSRELIHLGVADMDFQAPEEIRNAFIEIVNHGIWGYTNLGEEFYSSIQRWIKKQTGEEIQKEWIVYCPRINVSGSLLVDVLTNKGDGVMIHSPHYMPLYHAIAKNERKVVESPLKWNGSRYEMDFEQMEQAVKDDTKMFLLCSPHNPCTTIFSSNEINRLAEFCNRHKLILVSDEIHSDIRKERTTFTSSLKFSNILKNGLVYVNSPTKTFNIPGIILSYLIIKDESIREKVKQEIDRIGMHNPNVFANKALETGYTKCDHWLEECNHYIDGNEDFVRNYMEENLKGFKIMPREGTYLLWIDCHSFGVSEERLEEWFVKEAKVGIYMGNVFGVEGRGFIRINIAAPRGLLKEALIKMKNVYQTLR